MNLIQRLEQASEGSRELDGLIYRLWAEPEWQPDPSEEVKSRYCRDVAPHFTTSLDAALLLVPKGWFTSDYHQGPSGGNWWNLSRIRCEDQRYAAVMGAASTPSLALCAAALKAKAQP